MNKINESIVLIGGGGGVYRIARFLKHVRPRISTIQTMFDHGGHSGKLRDERGVLPVGDIRQAVLALSDDEMEHALRALLTHRFSPRNNSSVDHATIGNLMLTALTEIYGNPISGIEAMCKIFRVKGKVLPVSLDHADLCAILSDGSVFKGEDVIDQRDREDNRTIDSVHLEPNAHLYTGAYDAIINADKIVFCPGDLFTSIIPNTLVVGFPEALARSKAKLVYVTNIMTKKSETHGFTASQFTKTLLKYIKRERLDAVICNTGDISHDLKKKYELEKSDPVAVDEEELHKHSEVVIIENLADQSSDIVRHNERVASLIAEL